MRALLCLKYKLLRSGPIKELRETPSKKHQKFVEFYDVRDAAKALKEMNGKEIRGKAVVIEFSRPGGHSRKFMNAMVNAPLPPPAISTINNISSVNTVPSLYPRIHKYPASPPPPSILPRKFTSRSAFNVVPHRPCTSAPHPQFSAATNYKKSNSAGKASCNGNTANKSSTGGGSNISLPMASLNLGGGAVCNGGGEENDSNGHHHHHQQQQPKRLTRNKSQSNQAATVVISKQQQQQPRNRPRKGRQAKKFDTRFLINEDAMRESSNCRDSRTTVMIKNIPNKYRFCLALLTQLKILTIHVAFCFFYIFFNEEFGIYFLFCLFFL